MPDLPPTSVRESNSDEPDRTGQYEGAPTPFSGDAVEAGTIIAGKYKLLQSIGEGGMGAVWMAQQIEPVKRLVALKLIKAGMDSKTVIARFEAERQALSMMDHPNIARVFDVGTTPTGRPFFVMELVKGTPITEFCDARKMTPKQRLELFVPVCNAIQHAHQKGIIHRDIKPSNVLVALHDDKPVPKVIDFGVAKAIGQPLTERTLHTAFEQVVGTPAYMSPEQATFNQLDIDTRSDVYSLGVLLYELLTGTTPIECERFRKVALMEMLRVVREEEPPRPSTRLSSTEARASIAAVRGTEPARLSRELRSELDWVVMKSLEKDRTRRYATAVNFAEDVQRYLSGEPVFAHPPSTTYRMRKFVRKQRGPVIASGLVLVALLAGIAGTTVGLVRAEQARSDEAEQRKIAEEKERDALQAVEEERQAKLREAAQLAIAQQKEKEALEEKTKAVAQRERAEKARDRTREVLDAMTSEVTGDSLATQKAITEEQKKFLAEVLTYYKEFAGEKSDDERSRKRTAVAAYKVGLIEYRLGRMKESASAFRIAIEGYAALAADLPTVPEYRQELAASHNNLGVLLKNLGMRTEAEGEHRKALAIQEKLAADFPTLLAYRQGMAGSYGNLGLVLAELGRPAEAEGEYRKALAIQKKLATEFPAVPEYPQDLAKNHNNLGMLLVGLGKRSEAEGEYRKALAIREKLAANFPAVPEYRQDLAAIHNNLAALLDNLRKWAEAETEYRKALAIREKLAAEFPAIATYRLELAASHFNLGLLHVGLGKRVDAESEYHKALVIFEKLTADFPAIPAYRQALAGSHNNLGVLLAKLGKQAEAESECHKALTIFKNLAADFPGVPVYLQHLALSHNNLGNRLKEFGKRADAEVEYRNALTIFEKLATDFPAIPVYRQDLAGSYNNMRLLFEDLGQWVEAETEFRKALAILEKLATDYPAVPEYRSDMVGGWYDFACFFALTSQKVVYKKQVYADRSMEMLHKAVKAGYTDGAHMAKDTDLDPLRDRADFKKLIESLQQKPKGK